MDKRAPGYYAWRNAKRRCYEKENRKYHLYGGRGIEMCDRWYLSFANFVEDMGVKPAGMSLDRRDNDGNYEKSNCRWVTKTTSNRNRRTVNASVRAKAILDDE
jgi:hypothetical protein